MTATMNIIIQIQILSLKPLLGAFKFFYIFWKDNPTHEGVNWYMVSVLVYLF